MPQAVAEVEQMRAVIFRKRLAVLVEIGNVVEPRGTEPVILLLGDVAAARIFTRAEIQREGHLLVV